jgi:5'-nucleotidase
MSRSWVRWVVAAAILAFGPAGAGHDGLQGVLHAQAREDQSLPRSRAPLTILQINDVYSTVPIDDVGGLARVATIKKQLSESGRTPFLMIAGDFLSSSVASTVFKGEQMVAALNAAGVDVATLGNHEFDFGVDTLLARMAEAKWQWVIANVVDRRTGRALGDAPPYVVRTFGSLKIGVLGLCLTDNLGSPELRGRLQFIDPIDAAAKYLPEMKREGANVIVALTHMTYGADRALAERFPEIDVIVGGHEHAPITSVVGRTLISKAGSEARYVARIDVNNPGASVAERFYELIPVTAAIKDDPAAAEVINEWEARLGTELDLPIGSTRVALDSVDARLRASETNLGNFVADAVRHQVQADAAIVNSGGIRGNRLYPAGPLSRRLLLQIHPFGNVVCKIEVTGALLQRALEHGVSRLPLVGGQFPQVSGLTLHVDASAPAGSRVRDVRVNGTPLDPARTYTLAIPDYLLHGGDGYEMFEGSTVLIDDEAGPLVVSAIEAAVRAGELNPQIEQRIAIER